MGVFFLLASFPNSRNKPRPATTDAITYQVALGNLAVPYVRVAAATGNRTYITLKNFSNSDAFYYVYALTTAVNPSSVATFGNTGDMIFFTGTSTLYQKQDVGTSTNWTTVLIQNVGESIDPLQSGALESPQDIYAAGALAGVIVGVDQGTG